MKGWKHKRQARAVAGTDGKHVLDEAHDRHGPPTFRTSRGIDFISLPNDPPGDPRTVYPAHLFIAPHSDDAGQGVIRCRLLSFFPRDAAAVSAGSHHRLPPVGDVGAQRRHTSSKSADLRLRHNPCLETLHQASIYCLLKRSIIPKNSGGSLFRTSVTISRGISR